MRKLPPVTFSCQLNIRGLQFFSGVSVFVLFLSVPDKPSRETIAVETPSWWRPTHPSLHTSNPLAAVYYTNKINTISSCFLAIRSHFSWCMGLFFWVVGANFGHGFAGGDFRPPLSSLLPLSDSLRRSCSWRVTQPLPLLLLLLSEKWKDVSAGFHRAGSSMKSIRQRVSAAPGPKTAISQLKVSAVSSTPQYSTV